MDSSELTKFRRNRTEANSNNGQKATKPANKITQMSAQSALNIFLGGRRVIFDKKPVLPNCAGKIGEGCTQDILDDGTLLPPDCPQVLSISYLNSNQGFPYNISNGQFCITNDLPVYTFNVIFGPGTPTNGTFSMGNPTQVPTDTNPFPQPPYLPPIATVDATSGTLTVPADLQPPNAVWTVTYTTACGQTQVSIIIGPC
jgi:hypothetical protein